MLLITGSGPAELRLTLGGQHKTKLPDTISQGKDQDNFLNESSL